VTDRPDQKKVYDPAKIDAAIARFRASPT